MRYWRSCLLCLAVVLAGCALAPSEASASDPTVVGPQRLPEGGSLPIPDDGTWLEVYAVDQRATSGAVLSEVNARLLVEHPDIQQLEMELTRRDSDIVVPLPLTEREGTIFGEVTDLHAFDGLPSAMTWVFRVRDTVPGGEGRVVNLSLVGWYVQPTETPAPTPRQVPEGAGHIAPTSEPASNMPILTKHLETILLYVTPEAPEKKLLTPDPSASATRTPARDLGQLDSVIPVCSGGICLHLALEKPVKALEPALVSLAVRTDRDLSGVRLSLAGDDDSRLVEIIESPDNAELFRQDESFLFWSLDTKAQESYVFAALVSFDQSTGIDDVWYHHVAVVATHLLDTIVIDLEEIRLDADGNQVEGRLAPPIPAAAEEVPGHARTPVARPTSTRRPTWTPTPIPSLTPTRTPSPTRMMGYPARTLVATPTLSRAYPEP